MTAGHSSQFTLDKGNRASGFTPQKGTRPGTPGYSVDLALGQQLLSSLELTDDLLGSVAEESHGRLAGRALLDE